MKGKTLFEKIWSAHIVEERPGHPTVLYVDLHGLHEVSSRQAFDLLAERKIKVAQPKLTSGTLDSVMPTAPDRLLPSAVPVISEFVQACAENGIECFGMDSPNRGILQVIHPELGLTLPGSLVVNADSHTCTQGALGALAFGIGTTEVGYVLATQCILQRRPKTLHVKVDGKLGYGVCSKDLALYILANWGVGIGRGHAIEYSGPAIRALTMEARLTLCNMSAELGSRWGMIAPDETTFEYLHGRPYAPSGRQWDEAVQYWRTLHSDPDAAFDNTIEVDGDVVTPMVTYGTTPGMGVSIDGMVPDPAQIDDPAKRETATRALRYMDLVPGEPILGRRVDAIFIGGCTNGRIEDLRLAASVLKDRTVSSGLRAMAVPGSRSVQRQAEHEGLDQVFRDAGFEWGEPSCSMCLSLNGDELRPKQYSVSTTNRNFEDRQGPGARTFLASPLTAAVSAIEGRVADPRPYLKAASKQQAILEAAAKGGR